MRTLNATTTALRNYFIFLEIRQTLQVLQVKLPDQLLPVPDLKVLEK